MTNSPKMMLFKIHKRWLIPLLALLIITPFTPYLDLKISGLFYQDNGQFWSGSFLEAIFDYAVLPAEILGVGAFFTYVGSFLSDSLKKWRQAMLCIVLTIGIGAGVMVHLILKDHWGRPRPKQSLEFAGEHPFQPYYKPNFSNSYLRCCCRSFPCGHCSMGFAFFPLYLLGLRYRNKKMEIIGLMFALGLGILLSYGRIAQGGHFFSDTLVSALIMWWTALSVDYLVYERYTETHSKLGTSAAPKSPD